jgi:ubiquinone/menaquinone biosynthesis C-methylase UbiE
METDRDREKSKLAKVYSDIDALVSAADIIVAHSTNKKNIRELALEELDLGACEDILDLGCAFGPFTRVLKGKVHPDACVTGIDCHRHYEDVFRRSCTEAGVKGKFYASGISEIAAFEEKSFDLILSSYSLYFFPEYLCRISELLKDSGIFVAVTHCLPHMKELTDLVKNILVKTHRFAAADLPLETLIARFSNENGYEILSPWMGNIKTLEYKNSLIFGPADVTAFIEYFRYKSDFFIPSVTYSKDNLMENIEFMLKKEMLSDRSLVISKDDVIFVCSEPLHRKTE